MDLLKFVPFKSRRWRPFFKKKSFWRQIGRLRSHREACPEYRSILFILMGLSKFVPFNGYSPYWWHPFKINVILAMKFLVKDCIRKLPRIPVALVVVLTGFSKFVPFKMSVGGVCFIQKIVSLTLKYRV